MNRRNHLEMSILHFLGEGQPVEPSEILVTPTLPATSLERRMVIWELIDRGEVILTDDRRLALAGRRRSE